MLGLMFPRNPRSIPVVAVVVRRGADYLLGLRPATKHHGGLWEFPGGKLEPGETLAAAARREIREELQVGLAAAGEVLAVIDDGQVELHFMAAELLGEPMPLEHDMLRWCDLAELRTLPLAPVDRLFVDQTLLPCAEQQARS